MRPKESRQPRPPNETLAYKGQALVTGLTRAWPWLVPVPGVPERGVQPAPPDELRVRADLVQQPFLDDGDPVRIVRGVQPMGDRDHGAPFEHGRERTLEKPRRAGGEQRRGLVEDERVRVGEDEASQRDLLRRRGRQ